MDFMKEWLHLAKVGLGVGILGLVVNIVITLLFTTLGIGILSLSNPAQMISAGIVAIALYIIVALPASGWVADTVVKNPMTR